MPVVDVAADLHALPFDNCLIGELSLSASLLTSDNCALGSENC